MELIDRERNGETVNSVLMRKITDQYVALGLGVDEEGEEAMVQSTLGVYKTYFEEGFLARTADYYRAESSAFLSSNSVTEYMKKVQGRLEEEEKRMQTYLHESTYEELFGTCERIMIAEHVDKMHAEFPGLLEQEQLADLNNMYELLSRIPDGLAPLRVILKEHIKSQGLKALETEGEQVKEPKSYVTCLQRTHRRYEDLVARAFAKDASFSKALDDACREFMNDNCVTQASPKGPVVSPELLAKYTDMLLKKSSTETDDLDSLLDGVMVVFKFLDNQDVYQKFYSKHLSFRLVAGASVSDDAESGMISRLKALCGYEYSARFQRMFQDVGNSKELNAKFVDWWKKSDLAMPVRDPHVLVLTSNCWPFKANVAVKLPQQLQAVVDKFETFYKDQHSGRKLDYVWSQSKGEVVTLYTKDKKTKKPTRYTLTAFTTQIAILSAFNMTPVHTLESLGEVTGIEAAQLKMLTDQLLKMKLLKLTGAEFAVALEFTYKRPRVNIAMTPKAESRAEDQAVHQMVLEDRKIEIKATLVRVMKARRRLEHQRLIEETIKLLSARFTPDVKAIKKQIAAVMDEEYIERDGDSRSTYLYKA